MQSSSGASAIPRTRRVDDVSKLRTQLHSQKGHRNSLIQLLSASHDVSTTDNLATLDNLHEDALCEQLKRRYQSKCIYTYIGDILVAINPFEELPIYGSDVSETYAVCHGKATSPHIYAIADAAYSAATSNQWLSQTCIVSGESGSGKTETTKHIIQHILRRSSCEKSDVQLNEQIFQMSPVLEAFGNAKTVLNNNSSRFGKYLEITLNDRGNVVGGVLSDYLLERSRVVTHAFGERSFHIFYFMTSGLGDSLRRDYKIGPPSNFEYLQVENISTDLQLGQVLWEELTNAIQAVGFSTANIEDIVMLLAVTLHLGNIRFDFTDTASTKLDVSGDDACVHVAKLLMVQPTVLNTALTTRTNVIRGETITKDLLPRQARDICDATAKAIYGNAFKWLVARINRLLMPQENQGFAKTSIGLLDIFGFENFQTNSFEQMCINFANETLQFFFNEHVFQLEINEYRSQGLTEIDFTYTDNKPVLDLFSQKPLNIFSLLDEECRLQSSSTDKSLARKIAQHLDKSRVMQFHHNEFSINHFAGTIWYKFTNLISKNRDELPELIADLLSTSQNRLIRSLFGEAEESSLNVHELSQDRGLSKRLRAMFSGKSSHSRNSFVKSKVHRAPSFMKSRNLSVSTTTGRYSLGGIPEQASRKRSVISRGKKKKLQTVSSKFTASLSLLVAKMEKCDPHFVRCIKPNQLAKPSAWDVDYVAKQLKSTGMLETIRIRKEGYSVRLLFAEFLKQYGSISFALSKTFAKNQNVENVTKILERAGVRDWQIGKTKVFLKYYHVGELAKLRETYARSSVIIQSWWRGVKCQQRFSLLLAEARKELIVVQGFTQAVTTLGSQFSHLQQVTAKEDSRRYIQVQAVAKQTQLLLDLERERKRMEEQQRQQREQEHQEHQLLFQQQQHRPQQQQQQQQQQQGQEQHQQQHHQQGQEQQQEQQQHHHHHHQQQHEQDESQLPPLTPPLPLTQSSTSPSSRSQSSRRRFDEEAADDLRNKLAMDEVERAALACVYDETTQDLRSHQTQHLCSYQSKSLSSNKPQRLRPHQAQHLRSYRSLGDQERFQEISNSSVGQSLQNLNFKSNSDGDNAMSSSGSNVPPANFRSLPAISKKADVVGQGTALDMVMSPKCLDIPEIGTLAHAKHSKRLRKDAVMWFNKTQRHRVTAGTRNSIDMDNQDLEVACWFHGFLSRDDAETRLQDCVSSTFMVRICYISLAYTLSVIQNGRCRHYKIVEERSSSLGLEHQSERFTKLQDLITYYTTHDVSTRGDLCSYPYGHVSSAQSSIQFQKEPMYDVVQADDSYTYATLLWDDRTCTKSESVLEKRSSLHNIIKGAGLRITAIRKAWASRDQEATQPRVLSTRNTKHGSKKNTVQHENEHGHNHKHKHKHEEDAERQRQRQRQHQHQHARDDLSNRSSRHHGEGDGGRILSKPKKNHSRKQIENFTVEALRDAIAEVWSRDDKENDPKSQLLCSS